MAAPSGAVICVVADQTEEASGCWSRLESMATLAVAYGRNAKSPSIESKEILSRWKKGIPEDQEECTKNAVQRGKSLELG